MSSLRSLALALALALVLAGLGVAAIGVGVDEADSTGKGLGGKTVGARSAQPGNLLRSIQPTVLITGPLNVLLTALTGIGNAIVEVRQAGSPPRLVVQPGLVAYGGDRLPEIAAWTRADLAEGQARQRTSQAGLYSSSPTHAAAGPTGVSDVESTRSNQSIATFPCRQVEGERRRLAKRNLLQFALAGLRIEDRNLRGTRLPHST